MAITINGTSIAPPEDPRVAAGSAARISPHAGHKKRLQPGRLILRVNSLLAAKTL